jgi:hypothetical protein
LQEGVVLSSPSKAGEIEQRMRFFDVTRPIALAQSPECVGAEKDEAIDPIGMSGRVFNGDRPTPALGQEIESWERGRLDDAFQIQNPRFE